jgi:hypothetical protein
MEAIFLTDDELKRLETRFGPVVRQMGPWNSDGIFGYASVSIMAVEKAAETLAHPNLMTALPRLRTSERTRALARPWSNESFMPTGSSRLGLIPRR